MTACSERRRPAGSVLPMLVLLMSLGGMGHAEGPAAFPPSTAWPRSADHVAMWWLHGFPAKVGGAPAGSFVWHRCVRTGRYAFVLDTSSLTVPHLGPIDAAYGAGSRDDDARIVALPAAELGLFVQHDGTTYRCVGGAPWNGLSGPRLIESGRFLARADVDGLVFKADDGQPLNAESRFETVAWPDRLALVLAVRPGLEPLPKAAAAFGRVGGGYGFDGTNHLEFKHSPALDPATFTLECWVYVPDDHAAATKAYPWILCKDFHEQADGNYGISVTNGAPQARLNIGGGRDNAFSVSAGKAFKREAWNHVAMTYDGAVLRLFLDGKLQGEKRIDRPRQPGNRPLAVARRQDNSGDGYHFKGAIDELAIYDRALSPEQIRARFEAPDKPLADPRPGFTQSFRTDGTALSTRPREPWKQGRLAVRLTASGTTLTRRLDLAEDAGAEAWHEVALTFDPAAIVVAGDTADSASLPAGVTVSALGVGSDGGTTGDPLPVAADPVRSWHRIDLDGVEPLLPPGGAAAEQASTPPRDARNDALERVRLRLTNNGDEEQPARLLLAKTAFRGPHVGTPITGLSAVLRDADGHPTGIPVQLSKNWHRGRGGHPYDGQWFHGFTQVRLPPKSAVDLELVIAYGHWGGVPAASHAQLSLLGWGSNQLWDESAIGSWGESICYEPDQIQGGCSILDVRPLLVRETADARPWQWTGNVGGGDFLRLFDREGRRVPHAGMRTAYLRHGPCLTEVTYAGRVGTGIDHSATVSLARSDDIVRGIYRLRMDVREPVAFSRLAIFQIGADSYSYARERQFAMGDAAGLSREWAAQWGGDTYRGPPQSCGGQSPWVSLSGVDETRDEKAMPVGNRGLVIRQWRAQLGGHETRPFVAEHGTPSTNRPSSTIDVVPPPGVERLEPGDFVEATFEHVIVPISAAQYYGPSAALRTALETTADPWRLIHREAVGNDRRVDATRGTVLHLYPDIRLAVADSGAEFVLHGGLGHVPLTFAGLESHRGGRLEIDGVRVDQSVHGHDFWQTDYDPQSGTWSQTYTVPCPGEGSRHVTFTQ